MSEYSFRESIQPKYLHQPKALYFLFLIELWERFGFYITRGLLVLYLAKLFLFTDSRAYLLFGAFTALLWFTPIIGGYVADKVWGYRRTLIVGALCFILGYGLLISTSIHMFYLGLSFILVGNGFFKPNVASLMGSLYDKDDPRRDGGFTIYYMGINVGALLATVFAGALVEYWGWRSAFATSSAGMFIGLVLFLSGARVLGDRGLCTRDHLKSARWLGRITYSHLVYVLLALLIASGYVLLQLLLLANVVLAVFGTLFVALFIRNAMKRDVTERNRMLACLILILFSIIFWVLYQQAPASVNLFTERNVARTWFGHTIPTVTFQSLNPFFIITLTPVLNILWRKINKPNNFTSIPTKFVTATFLMGAGFLVLDIAARYFASDGLVNPLWLVLSYGLQSLGELILQPVGLAAMTALAPPDMVSIMLGLWFFASAIANALSGWVAQVADIPQSAVAATQSLHIYEHAFSLFGWSTIGFAAVGLLFVRKVGNMIG